MSTFGLTACLIVRDERENLETLLPVLMDTVDDVIVVDTGSTDGTREYVRAEGARLLEDPWSDDFSRARNTGLAEVRTSHVVWLDADDRVEAETLAKLRDECRARPELGFFLLLVNESPDPGGVTSCWQLRAFPAHDRHRFRGRVHEQIADALAATGTATDRLDLTIRHTGYADPEQVVRKARRNLELARREADDGAADASVLYHWVKAATGCGELDEAAEVACRLLDSPPAGASPEVLQATTITLGNIESQRGRSDEALERFREAVRRVPDDPLARFFLGDQLRQRGDLGGALTELQAARLAPVRQGGLPLPVLGLRRATRLLLGEVLEKLGRPAEAAAIYREAVDELPDDSTCRLALARALLGAGAPADALGQLDRIPADGTGASLEADLLRGVYAFNRGEDARAEEYFTAVRTRMPHSWPAALHLGHLRMRNGDTEGACRYYEEALRVADNAETRVGMAAGALESGNAAAALDHLAEAVERSPERPLPRGTEALAGEALARIGRLQEALGAFERHLRRQGPDARILARVADCYRQLGAPEAARVGYTEALRLAPGLPEANRGLDALAAAG